jgi:hypothetical protein
MVSHNKVAIASSHPDGAHMLFWQLWSLRPYLSGVFSIVMGRRPRPMGA